MEQFIDHLSRLTNVSKELKNCLLERTKEMRVAKGEYLHSAGEICNRTFWVAKGLLRTYYLKDGREITDGFAAEGESLTSVNSFMTGKPDQYYLQAIENSTLFSLTNTDLLYLFDHFIEMERYGRITMSIYYIKLSARLESYQFTTAKEKYDHFTQTYRAILGRLPLGMIASYLGISQETLSRIRKQA
jgi:CRP-like cAMP-binding protein